MYWSMFIRKKVKYKSEVFKYFGHKAILLLLKKLYKDRYFSKKNKTTLKFFYKTQSSDIQFMNTSRIALIWKAGGTCRFFSVAFILTAT